MTKFLGNAIRWFIVIVWIALLIAFYFLRANADSTGNRKAAPPYVAFYNPHEYSLGTVAEVVLIHPERDKTWTVVRWKPAYAPLLYDESLNFCGNQSKMFAGVRIDEEIVLVYSRAIEVARDSDKVIIACRSLDYVRKMNTGVQP